jgi:multiple sugar transport system ATP-binding protein
VRGKSHRNVSPRVSSGPDPPKKNLDAKRRARMRTELQRIQEDLNTTTIYVTHDQTEAMTMGDRIAVLDDGQLQQVGTPLECYHEPNNRFVAGFIGEPSMNFFEVENDAGTLVGRDFEYPLSNETAKAVEGRKDITLGIRPEDIEVTTDGDGDHDFATTVDVVEPMGDENNVYLVFDRNDRDDPRTFVVTVDGMRRVEAGESVVAHVPEDALHLFDGRTGEALRNRRLDAVETLEPQV